MPFGRGGVPRLGPERGRSHHRRVSLRTANGNRVRGIGRIEQPHDETVRITRIPKQRHHRGLRVDRQRKLVYVVRPGAGWAYDTSLLGLGYFMIETDMQLSSALKGGYSLGGGATLGMVRKLGPRWKLQLQASEMSYALGDEDDVLRLEIGQNLELSPNWSVMAAATRVRERDDWRWEWAAMLNVFR